MDLNELMPQPEAPSSKKGLGNLFAQKNSPRASVLEADFSQGRQISIIYHEFVNKKWRRGIFHKFWNTCPSKTSYFMVKELKVPRPAPPGSGAPRERLRPPSLHTSGQDPYVWGEEVKRSIVWLIKRWLKLKSRVSYLYGATDGFDCLCTIQCDFFERFYGLISCTRTLSN